MNESNKIKNFQKVLIANRGEIAIRIIKSAKKLGLKTVAVYSEEDADSPHLTIADEKINIGLGPAFNSYLSIKKIINAAKITKSDAIHPGYGFLSENANFAKKCLKEKIVFIGPDSITIQKMGDKKIAKNIAIKAGVPCLPDFKISSNTKFSSIVNNAKKIGFPIMLKATKGGGGKGMRLVLDENELKNSLNIAKSESMSSFGSDEIIIEKAILKAKHIEVQIMGDNYGNIIHFGDRDCSIQRRHQKIIEEAPATGIRNEIKSQLVIEATKLSKAINYKGAGTVEFLIDKDQNFFFLEMNTRLQVEHPVTEMITNLDLVELQLLIADGQQLPINQNMIKFNGHAIEARLYAEDPRNNFFPSFGKLVEFNFKNSNNIRVDSGVIKNQTISSFYDPMLAKIISFSKTRSSSINQLKNFLSHLSILGIKSNRDFLIDILSKGSFLKEGVNTSFIEESYPNGIILKSPTLIDFAAFSYLIFKNQFNINIKKTSGIHKELRNWSNINNLGKSIQINCFGDIKNVYIVPIETFSYEINIEEENFLLEFIDKKILINKKRYDYNKLYKFNDIYYLVKNKVIFEFSKNIKVSDIAINHSSGDIVSPMHGVISQIKVQDNKKVLKGDILFILEAMKMKHEILADVDGIVHAIKVKKGSQVSTGDILLNIMQK